MVLRPDFSPRRLSMGDSHQEGSHLTGRGHDLSPLGRVVEAVGVAPEGAQLIASCLSTEVAETILQSRAPLNEETVRPEVETHGAETASLTQLTARLVQCWSFCRPVSLQG